MTRIEELMIQWQDNTMSAIDFVEFKQLLEDKENRKFMVESLLTDAVIREGFQSNTKGWAKLPEIEAKEIKKPYSKKWLIGIFAVLMPLIIVSWVVNSHTYSQSNLQIVDGKIYVSSVRELEVALASIENGQTLILNPGVYEVSSLHIQGKENIVVMGASKNPSDVIIRSHSEELAMLYCEWSTGVRLAYLTFQEAPKKGLILKAGSSDILIEKCHFQDAKEEMIFAYEIINNVTIRECSFRYSRGSEFESGARPHAVYCHSGGSWEISGSVFENIIPLSTSRLIWEARAAVFVFGKSTNLLVKGNVFLNCHRSIIFGIDDREECGDAQISNNYIAYHRGFFDRKSENSAGITPYTSAEAPILIWGARSADIFHNTIYTNQEFPKSVEVRWTDGVRVIGNLTDAPVGFRNEGRALRQENHFGLNAEWFKAFDTTFEYQSGDPFPEMDLRLNSIKPVLMDRVDPLLETDHWGRSRPQGARSDIGAEELSQISVSNE